MSQDPAFMEAINKHMRVPERLSVGSGQQWRRGEEEEETTRREEHVPPAFTMQVPDRLTYTEAPDMSPTPLFTPSKLTLCGPQSLDPCWESPSGEVFIREQQQSPIRRSYSDQSFGRTPPGTPTKLKQTLARHPSSLRGSGRPLLQRSSPSAHTSDPQAQHPPSSPYSLSSPQSFLQTARALGLQASQRLLQAVTQKYRLKSEGKPPAARFMAEVPAAAQVELSKRRVMMESWSPEEDGGAAVEFIILRRQVMKMSRRLASLERHSTERRNTEVVLFSLLLSACMLNVWLWIRR
ncbi:mitochondrial fission factor-like isoform X1 [Labrus bergylta]|uniref:mitochondrial fission factor-like isoform X1 n=1 Tax=Labrus bergylta TaxID=56723 RepID=UPI0009B4C316|nr:mitochondrial fission factor-like isoform X1 [Labrus bergylta]XP_029136073.1 mitochondrial fission factor-like isoform X1 [Labrus bergylta]